MQAREFDQDTRKTEKFRRAKPCSIAQHADQYEDLVRLQRPASVLCACRDAESRVLGDEDLSMYERRHIQGPGMEV